MGFSFWAGNKPRLDGRKAELAMVVGGHAAETRKARLQRLLLRVFRMSVFTVRIGLPDFDHSIGDRVAIPVEYPAFNRQTFS